MRSLRKSFSVMGILLFFRRMKYTDNQAAVCQSVCVGGQQLSPPLVTVVRLQSCFTRCPMFGRAESGWSPPLFAHAANYAFNPSRLPATRKPTRRGSQSACTLAPLIWDLSKSAPWCYLQMTHGTFTLQLRRLARPQNWWILF